VSGGRSWTPRLPWGYLTLPFWHRTCSPGDPLLNVGVLAVGVGVGKILWSAGQATVEVVGTVAKVVGTVADVAGNVVEVVADALEA
jgi:hypothetical protein